MSSGETESEPRPIEATGFWVRWTPRLLRHPPDVVRADVERQLRVDGVVRAQRRARDRDRPGVAVVVGAHRPRLPRLVVVLAPGPGRAGEGRRGVVGRVGIDPLLDRGREHERLEGRARLPGRLRGQVELVVLVPGDHRGHRADRAGARAPRRRSPRPGRSARSSVWRIATFASYWSLGSIVV